MAKHYDFAGFATKFDIECTDGRTIKHSAFIDQLPARVPLVWNHNHNNPECVLGHVDLEARPDGVYAYGAFTTGEGVSDSVKHAKALIEHGDIDSLSIYANQLVQHGKDVVHGMIREVSLVHTGANPGAKIMNTDLSHSSEDGRPFAATIYGGYYCDMVYDITIEDDSELAHSGEEKGDENKGGKTVADVLDTLNEEQQAAVVYLLKKQEADLKGGKAAEPKKDEEEAEPVKHADESKSDKTVGDVLETLNDEQKAAVMYVIEQLKNKGDKSDDDTESEEETEMKHHAFNDNAYMGVENTPNTLSHADEKAIWKSFLSGSFNTFKDAVLAYAEKNDYIAHADTVDMSNPGATYGFEDIEWLFPDAKVLSNEPLIIDRRQEWVKHFMGKTTHLPVSRIKSIYADITGDDARAKGYAKKAQIKIPEVIKLLKHTTQPTTVYKMQTFDKDDLRDIVNFDPLKWIDGEMTGKLHEEIARAAMFGDGREDSDPYKIDEDCIVPITKANKLFAIRSFINVAADATDAEIAVEAMDQAVRAKKDYRGSGNTTLYTTEDRVCEMALLKDVNGRRIFDSNAQIAAYMRVADIQTVELMEGITAEYEGEEYEVFGIIVNPTDYAFGSDKGSAIESFRQFDIKYNQEIILKEVRMSGTLRVPYSAIILLIKKTA